MTRSVLIAEVRERLAASAAKNGGRMQLRSGTDPIFIGRVLDRVGDDAEMAADALLIEPRPKWVCDLVGCDLMAVYPAGAR